MNVTEGVNVADGVKVFVAVAEDVNVGIVVPVWDGVQVRLAVGVRVGVKVGVKVAVLVTVPVTMDGVRLRVGVADISIVCVIVGVRSPGPGARAMAIHPRQ